MNSPLTGRERVNRMFERRDHDRVPRHDSYWPETITRWQGEGLKGDSQTALDELGSDFHGLCWTWPASFPGRSEIVSEDADTKVVRDGHGKLVRYWKNKSGTPEHLGFDCDTREKWEAVYKPALLNSGLQLDPAAAVRNSQQARGRWTYLAGVEGFEQTRALMGDEITLMALAEDPDWVRDVSETCVSVVLRNFDAVLAAGAKPDGIWIYGDMAFKTATMCSPQMYREVFWPDHKRLADWAHARGMKMIYHTDGNVNGVIDLYIGAGIDCLQPLECKAGMDLRTLCPAYNDRLAFFGNIDVMTMITNDRARIETEVAAKLAAAKPAKGYSYHSDHSVAPQVSLATYRFIIELLERYGKY